MWWESRPGGLLQQSIQNTTQWMCQLACQPRETNTQIGALLSCHALTATQLEWLLYIFIHRKHSRTCATSGIINQNVSPRLHTSSKHTYIQHMQLCMRVHMQLCMRVHMQEGSAYPMALLANIRLSTFWCDRYRCWPQTQLAWRTCLWVLPHGWRTPRLCTPITMITAGILPVGLVIIQASRGCKALWGGDCAIQDVGRLLRCSACTLLGRGGLQR